MEGWLDLSLFRQMRKRCLPAIGGSCYMSVFNFFYRGILIKEDFKIQLGPPTIPLDTLNQALKRSTKGLMGQKESADDFQNDHCPILSIQRT